MPPILSPLALAIAVSLALFGCEEMERGPSGPEPPKATSLTAVDAAAMNGAPAATFKMRPDR